MIFLYENFLNYFVLPLMHSNFITFKTTIIVQDRNTNVLRACCEPSFIYTLYLYISNVVFPVSFVLLFVYFFMHDKESSLSLSEKNIHISFLRETLRHVLKAVVSKNKDQALLLINIYKRLFCFLLC